MRIVAAALILSVAFLSPKLEAADLLTIGSDAPTLDIEHWVQDGNGKFQPVTKFSSGKVYIVEFWATWCGPCIQSMPHLAALQAEYAAKGVQIVSISDEDLETVEAFLEKEVRGSQARDAEEASTSDNEEPKKTTYRELTSAYCLTTDPDQSTYEDYMLAAAQNGIPTAFIVGKDSKIEWIGHPMELDQPLAAVVEGTWDREAFAEEIRAKQEAEKAMQEIFALLQKQEFDEAITSIDSVLSKDDSNLQLKMLKLQVLIASEKLDLANSHLSKLFTDLAAEPQAVNMIAWNIYEMAAQGRVPKGSLIESSMNASQAAFEKSSASEKWSVLDTMAHLAFVNGDLDQAIAMETEAKKLAESSDDRTFIQNFLEELEAAKKAASAKRELESADTDDK